VFFLPILMHRRTGPSNRSEYFCLILTRTKVSQKPFRLFHLHHCARFFICLDYVSGVRLF
jgi:hypothetical protein